MASFFLPEKPFGLVAPGFSRPQAKGRSAASQEAIDRVNALKESMRIKVQTDRRAPSLAGLADAAASWDHRVALAASGAIAARLPTKPPATVTSFLGQSDAQLFAASIEVEPGKKKISGRIQAITFEKDGFYYLKVLPHGKESRADEVFVKGNGIELRRGCDIVAVGNPKTETSEQYGAQNIIEKAIVFEVVPTTRHGIQRLLASGYVKGLGEDTATRLCNAFGEHLFEIAEAKPESLLNVIGVRANEVKALVLTVRAKKELPRLMTFLAEVGMNLQTSSKVLKELGPDAINKIKTNPYELMRVSTIGFAKADDIARGRGVLFNSDQRVAAALEACLESAAKKGSTYMKVTDAKVMMMALLELTDAHGNKKSVDFRSVDRVCEHELIHSQKLLIRHHMIDAQAPHLQSEGFAREGVAPTTERTVSLMNYAGMERRIAKRLASYMNSGVTSRSLGASPSGAHFDRLSEEQKQAVCTTLDSPVSVITGRPGCGKTTTTKSLVEAMTAAGLKVLMVAPTNRAAKQMSDATGQRAKTIHRALGCRGFDLYTYGPENPLICDVVIADEMSMNDTRMMDKLMSAIRPGTSLVIIGDKEQLASISAGNVLSDIIKSRVIPVSYLSKTRRTAEGSSINPNAHRVADRMAPIAPKPGENDDFCMREVRSAWHGAGEDVRLKAERDQIQAVIDQFNHYRSLGHRPEDIQIITPMRNKSKLGANELNKVMKEILNPARQQIQSMTTRNTFEPRTYSVGDRVMYIANDQERDIYNGDIGYIRDIDQQSDLLLIDFEGNEVELKFSELSDLDHAYVNTVHKTQGGEFPAVIFITVNEHYNMLDRQGIYTGMTRGKKNVCLLGDTHRLQTFVEKPGSENRKTMLDDELVKAFGMIRLHNDKVLPGLPMTKSAIRRPAP